MRRMRRRRRRLSVGIIALHQSRNIMRVSEVMVVVGLHACTSNGTAEHIHTHVCAYDLREMIACMRTHTTRSQTNRRFVKMSTGAIVLARTSSSSLAAMASISRTSSRMSIWSTEINMMRTRTPLYASVCVCVLCVSMCNDDVKSVLTCLIAHASAGACPFARSSLFILLFGIAGDSRWFYPSL